MVYKFCSTSKVSFPGSGVAAIAASDANLVAIRKQMQIQTIGHDKLNQLRHARFYKDIHGMVEHMKLHADILRPKFETVLTILERELEGLKSVPGYGREEDISSRLMRWMDVPRRLLQRQVRQDLS